MQEQPNGRETLGKVSVYGQGSKACKPSLTPTFQASLCVHQPGCSPNPVLQGLWGGVIVYVWLINSLAVPVSAQSFSCVRLFMTSWTVARQAPFSMGFSRQEYWRGLPFPTPGDLSSLGIKSLSPAYPALASRFLTTEPPGKPESLAYWGLLIS